MLNKVILQTQFGSPHPWTEQYLDDFAQLEKYGWYMKVFSPNYGKSGFYWKGSNVEIVPMTIEGFDELVWKYCKVKPKNYINERGVPAKLVSEYYPAYGHIFQDYIKIYQYWGHTNWDMVYGRIDHFLPDQLLESCDIWSDDVNAINGIFCMYKNTENVNTLFSRVVDWENQFIIHEPCAFDEVQMTCAVRAYANRGEIVFKYPPYFGYHSYDRLIQHQPIPRVCRESDGALIEQFLDPMAVNVGKFSMPKQHFGREIMSFHFIRTKKWPL